MNHCVSVDLHIKSLMYNGKGRHSATELLGILSFVLYLAELSLDSGSYRWEVQAELELYIFSMMTSYR